MYINTFKYTPADVDCKLCTEYVKKFGCTACGCPWMARSRSSPSRNRPRQIRLHQVRKTRIW